MKFISILLSLCLALALVPNGSWALTGGTVENSGDQELSEEEVLKLMDVATKFRDMVPEISVEDALGLAQLLKDVREDDETKMVVEGLKSAEFAQDPEFQKFLDAAKEEDILVSLIHVFDDLKALDVLFQNPTRAVEAVNNEGMIADDSRLKLYRQDPTLLEGDMRQGLYASFVSLAIAGGYL